MPFLPIASFIVELCSLGVLLFIAFKVGRWFGAVVNIVKPVPPPRTIIRITGKDTEITVDGIVVTEKIG